MTRRTSGAGTRHLKGSMDSSCGVGSRDFGGVWKFHLFTFTRNHVSQSQLMRPLLLNPPIYPRCHDNRNCLQLGFTYTCGTQSAHSRNLDLSVSCWAVSCPQLWFHEDFSYIAYFSRSAIICPAWGHCPTFLPRPICVGNLKI